MRRGFDGRIIDYFSNSTRAGTGSRSNHCALEDRRGPDVDENRCLQGKVKPGRDEFFDRVRNELEPLWRQFPHVTAVRVQRMVKHDGDARPIAMILEMDFPDMKAIDDCLASPIRPKSHDATEKVMALFEGRFNHFVAEATVLTPVA